MRRASDICAAIRQGLSGLLSAFACGAKLKIKKSAAQRIFSFIYLQQKN